LRSRFAEALIPSNRAPLAIVPKETTFVMIAILAISGAAHALDDDKHVTNFIQRVLALPLPELAKDI
jgi:hypothetical protein